MNKLIIREAELLELDTILEIEELSFTVPWTKDSFLSAFASDMITVFSAEKNGAAVGFGCVSVLAPDCEILNIAVHPDERGNGIGRLLLNAMLEYAAKNGGEAAFLEVRESNTPARTLYEKNGFIPIGIRRNYYSKPTENAIIMQLNLQKNTLQ